MIKPSQFLSRRLAIIDRLSKRNASGMPLMRDRLHDLPPEPPNGISRAQYEAECGDRWLARKIEIGDVQK